MLPSKETIQEKSSLVYAFLCKLSNSSFDDIQHFCQLDDVTTCLSLAELMRENKIRQEVTPAGVVYVREN